MVDGGEPGVDSRDEGKHTGRNYLLFVKKTMWMDVTEDEERVLRLPRRITYLSIIHEANEVTSSRGHMSHKMLFMLHFRMIYRHDAARNCPWAQPV